MGELVLKWGNWWHQVPDSDFWWQVLTSLLGRMYFFSANCVFCSKTSPLCEIKKLKEKHWSWSISWEVLNWLILVDPQA